MWKEADVNTYRTPTCPRSQPYLANKIAQGTSETPIIPSEGSYRATACLVWESLTRLSLVGIQFNSTFFQKGL